jgi:integrase/recombinase XerD
MVRDALQRAVTNVPDLAPLWKGDDDLILQLAGLK